MLDDSAGTPGFHICFFCELHPLDVSTSFFRSDFTKGKVLWTPTTFCCFSPRVLILSFFFPIFNFGEIVFFRWWLNPCWWTPGRPLGCSTRSASRTWRALPEGAEGCFSHNLAGISPGFKHQNWGSYQEKWGFHRKIVEIRGIQAKSHQSSVMLVISNALYG